MQYSKYLTGYSADGGGYYANISSPTAPIVYSPTGVRITSTGTLTDSNGNQITKTAVSSSETDWTDSAGRTALKIITNGTASTTYEYQDTSGSYRSIVVNYSSFPIKTNFGCSGIVEYTGTANLVTSIVLANNQKYSFSYEVTPGASGYYTGRIQKVSLPTGGTYQYSYSGSDDGISCYDAGVTRLQRTISDGTGSYEWQYSRSVAMGSGSTTTVTAPKLSYDSVANQSVFTFDSNGHETSAKIYRGSATGTALRTINTTWDSNGTPLTRTTILEDGSTQSEVETTFDGAQKGSNDPVSNGNLYVIKEHDWGSGGPGGILKTTTFTYLSGTSYMAANLIHRVTQKTVADSTGTIGFRQDTAYDGSGLINSPCISGAAQHDDTNFGCSFTARGNPTSVTVYTKAAAPSGPITKNLTYDSLGNLRVAQVDCCQQKQWAYSTATQYAYPDSVIDGGSGGPQLTTTFTYYFSTGEEKNETGPNNQTTSFVYNDAQKRLTGITHPNNSQVTYTYDDSGRTVTVNVPTQGSSAVVRETAYDMLGRPVKLTILDNGGTTYSETSTQYDAVGRPYMTSNPYTGSPQYWTTTHFDTLGRPSVVISPDGKEATYVYAENTSTVTDSTGKQLKTAADALGRITAVYEPDPTSGNSLTLQTSYTYNAIDKLLRVIQGSQSRTFTYDDAGRLTSASNPETDNLSYRYQYNSYGLVTQRTDPRGVTTTYTYDTLNRLKQVSYNVLSTGVPATPTVSFTYGTNASAFNNGRLITMTDGAGSENYTYDNLGRTIKLQKVVSGKTYTLQYAYNLADELTSVTYPSGRLVQQTYDTIGRLTKVADAAATYANSFSYNSGFQTTGFTYGNGVVAHFSYSLDRLQLASLSYVKGSSTLFSLTYSYAQNGGNNGQITGITDHVDSGRSAVYTYDALGRLSSAVTAGSAGYPKWGLSMSYDRYGNRLNQTPTSGSPPTNSVAINTATNQISGTGYSYDANGNMTGDGANALTYDADNRAVSVSGPYGSGSYTYDGNGLRVKKLSGGTSTVYVFSGAKVVAEYDNGAAPSSPSREYIYSGTTLLAKVENSTTTYYQSDQLSNRLITNSSGSVIGQLGHYPFGESWYSSGTTMKWAFTSYERDAESQNDYAMARYDVNRLGRFASPDPVGGTSSDPQSFNRYSYSRNDPINLVDPSGEFWGPQDYYLHLLQLGEGNPGGGWSEWDLLSPPPNQPALGIVYAYQWGQEDGGWYAAFSSFLLFPPGPANSTFLQRAKEDINKILEGNNDCASFFNSAPLVQANAASSLGSLIGPTTAAGFFQSDDVRPEPLSVFGSPLTGAMTVEGSGANSTIFVNAKGFMMNSFDLQTIPPKPLPGLGPFNANTVGTQVVGLLHELAHTLFLIPPDNHNPSRSEANTETILKHCLDAIKAALKPGK